MKSFARMRTAHKLLIGIAVCLVATLILSTLQVLQMEKLRAVSDEMTIDPLPGEACIAETTSDIKQFRLEEFSWLLRGGVSDPRLKSIAESVERDLSAYTETITKPEDQANFDRLNSLWRQYLQLHTRLEESAADHRREETVGLIHGEMAAVAGRIDDCLAAMIEWNRQDAVRLVHEASARFQSARRLLLCTILSLMLLGVLSLVFNQAVERPIADLAKTVRAVAEGQAEAYATVSGPAEVADVAREFNKMLDALRRAEAEMRTLNADLEERVEERTAQLTQTNQELAAEVTERTRMEERLRSKNDELKGFAYTVSHDLKAPLRGISGYAQELERKHREGMSERGGFCIRQILTASSNLDRLIEDLLLYSRLEAQNPTLSPINLPGLVEGLLKDRRETISERGIQIATEIEVTDVYDWERGLSQIFANLLDNAIKYTRDASPPRITIRAKSTPPTYQLIVGDNGIGFDMKYADRIFGLFNRLVRQDEFEGTGAGLAIVKRLIGKRGGRIWAEAYPGEGATFFVELDREIPELSV